jgi:hypothetical protein
LGAGNQSKKRKRNDKPETLDQSPESKGSVSQEEKNKLAMRNRIIGRKRMSRKLRKGG